MKNLFTLILVCGIFSASAQVSASLNTNTKDKNPICIERGHNLIHAKPTITRTPYTIDTKDSTVTVYPAANSTTARCSRCGAEIVNNEKDVRVTTWRRIEKKLPLDNPIDFDTIDWGKNGQRGLDLKIKSSSLNEIKKTATLRNDTLFIHKRIAPFKSLKEQVNKTTTIYYKNKPITFKTAIFDESTFYTGKNGLEIY
ncbi:MAG: hypothetical protein V4663_16090 [Bacteroidota bacterium]